MTVRAIELRPAGSYRVELRSEAGDLLYVVISRDALPSYELGRAFDIDIAPVAPASDYMLARLEEQVG